MEFAISVVLALFVVALILFPEFRKKLGVLIKGTLNVFIEDAAKTPEGADAVFSQAIEEMQVKYNQAANTLNKLSGELKHAEISVDRLTKEIATVEAKCEGLVKAGNMKDAEIYASRRAELISDLNNKKEAITRLKPMVADAQGIYEACGKKLRDLQRTRKETVEKLKMNTQLKDLLGDLDELKRDTATDKMLGAVLDGSDNLQKEVDGARIVHENRASTKLAKAEQNAAKAQNDEYLDSLKKKYGGK